MAGQSTPLAGGGGAVVRQMFADAEKVQPIKISAGPELGEELDGVLPGAWVPNRLGLPADCPVVPLGMCGNCAWFIDPIGQLQRFEPPYGKGHLLGLFCGDDRYLAWAWPRLTKDGSVDGYAAEKAAASLVTACKLKGVWNGVNQVRGRGVWLAADGRLIMHTGNQIIAGGRAEQPGEIDGMVYPARPRIPGPLPYATDEMDGYVRLVLEALRSWHWARPDVDPIIMLGWIGAGFLGGALPWRPSVFVTGDAATGKSTLQGLVKGIFGEWLTQTSNTTGAGIYQHIGLDCTPVAVDEMEGGGDNRKAVAVLELMRQAASGALMLRGGDRNNPVSFEARSAFLFSAINTPPLRPQDLSRMALLRLYRLKRGQQAPALSPQTLSMVGRFILRRLSDEWSRFSQTYGAFRQELSETGMDGRGQDTFGTLLTCADMILHRGWSDDRLSTVTVAGDVRPWRDVMSVSQMVEFEDRSDNWRLCLSHMLTVPVEAWRHGTRSTVGQALMQYWDDTRENYPDIEKEKELRQVLGQAGLGLVKHAAGDGRAGREALAVPNQSPLVRRLFVDSPWAGDVGASVWSQALRQAPRGKVYETARARVNGDVPNCTLIFLDGLYGHNGVMTLTGAERVTPGPDPL
jgi:hypothetical protein